MLFGSSGIRQKFSQELVEISLKVGSSLAKTSNPIVVGIDTRTTSPIISNAFISGCISGGAEVVSIGTAPTPIVAFHTRHVDVGCMVTASHNPEEYNGLKLFNPDGSSFTKDQQADLESDVKAETLQTWQGQGAVTTRDGIRSYISAVLDKVELTSEVNVILDCGGGAGSTVSPRLLSDLGAHPSCINCHPTGHFPRPSEPFEENLRHIPRIMEKSEACIAIVHDGDADRMMAFDEKRRYIDGDHLMMLFASYLGVKKIVTTVDASMAIEEMGEVRRTPVGDSYVSEALRTWGEFGGEPSGAWIFPVHSLCPDGPYAGALLARISSEWNISEELDSMPHYPVLRESVPCLDSFDRLKAIGADVPTDGVRLTFEEGWCLIRASGTEPKIRLTAEATTVQNAKAILEKGRECVRKGKLLNPSG